MLKKLFQGFHFKLNLKRGWGHQGELGWNQYNQALLKQMVNIVRCFVKLRRKEIQYAMKYQCFQIGLDNLNPKQFIGLYQHLYIFSLSMVKLALLLMILIFSRNLNQFVMQQAAVRKQKYYLKVIYSCYFQ